MPDRLTLSYILPLRHDRVEGVDEIAAYARYLTTVVDDVLVIDGSPAPIFAVHHTAFGPGLTHVPPDPRYDFANGKVDGVLTGLVRSRHEAVVVADEDVRWDGAALARVASLLQSADLVRPQNYFDPLPWHARWDTARTLLNRAFASDYPGTLGVRRSPLVAAGGYNGDAMFENLELIRTIRAAGGTAVDADDLYVRRLPPSTRQFWRQRVRQAYDDFAQPPRLVATLGLLPLVLRCLARRSPGPVLTVAAAAVIAAEGGRRRAGGRAVFPASCVGFAPLWLAERAVCAWAALGARVLWGGCRYRGRAMPLAAAPERRLRRSLLRGSLPHLLAAEDLAS